jgi:hypothetical protein
VTNIGDSLRSSAFEQNLTNPTAAPVDAKRPSIPSSSLGGTIVDIERSNNLGSTARDMERRFIYETTKNPNDNRRNNMFRLVSTAMAKGEGSVNTGADEVKFYLTPEIGESKQAVYAEISDIRQAASILIYMGSPSRGWSVNARFLSRTAEEANTTWKYVQLLKSWLNPDTNYQYGIDASGTPHVLKMYGYGRTWQGIPVVMKSLNVEYPSDIDMIPTAYGTNVPVIMNVQFQLTEARIPKELLEDFTLEKYKLGVLEGW